MDDRERAIRQRLKDDFAHYADKCLKIRTKAGGVEPFKVNRAQRYILSRLDQQLADTGRVRALILKGRQQGCSTLVEGRFYHKVTHRKGVQAFILSHEDESAKGIFQMAKRYHENCHPLVKPHTKSSNAKELIFDLLDSGYTVATAGNKGAGRSKTIQYFHGSEVAFWPNADEHMRGALQTISNEPGTEIILESTSNGPQGVFYDLWQAAERGESEYIAIFVPWYWQDEYRREVPKGFKRTEEEETLVRTYGLSDEQLQWRRWKTAELLTDIAFKREYPFTAEEAFAIGPDVFFENWTPKRHDGRPWHVIPNASIPKGYKYYLGVDWGFSDPFCALLIGIDPEGRQTICREIYETKLRTKEQGEKMLELLEANGLKRGQVLVYAGHDVFNRRLGSDGEYQEPIVDTWRRQHLAVVSAGRDPLARANVARELLADWGPDELWPDGRPGVQVMDCCKNLIRTLPLLKRDENKPEQVDTTLEDHAYDAWGHVATSMPSKPKKQQPEEEASLRTVRGQRQRQRAYERKETEEY